MVVKTPSECHRLETVDLVDLPIFSLLPVYMLQRPENAELEPNYSSCWAILLAGYESPHPTIGVASSNMAR